MPDKTLIILKPDCVQRNLVGKVISRFEDKGLKIVAMKFIHLDRGKAEFHYQEHRGKSFFDELVDFITSSPVIVAIFEGDNAVSIARRICGATAPNDSLPGTIRGDYALSINNNIVHSSDSQESALREIDNFFNENEIINYEKSVCKWI